MIDPASITIEKLSALADQIQREMPLRSPMAILTSTRSRIFDNLINMQIETIERAPMHRPFSTIPVYRTEWLPIIPHAKYLTLRRAQYKSRAAFKKARNYWRWFHRAAIRGERDVCYVFMEQMNRKVEEMMGIPKSMVEGYKPNWYDEARGRVEGLRKELRP